MPIRRVGWYPCQVCTLCGGMASVSRWWLAVNIAGSERWRRAILAVLGSATVAAAALAYQSREQPDDNGVAGGRIEAGTDHSGTTLVDDSALGQEQAASADGGSGDGQDRLQSALAIAGPSGRVPGFESDSDAADGTQASAAGTSTTSPWSVSSTSTRRTTTRPSDAASSSTSTTGTGDGGTTTVDPAPPSTASQTTRPSTSKPPTTSPPTTPRTTRPPTTRPPTTRRPTTAPQTTTTVPEISLANGGFEANNIAAGTYLLLDNSQVPGWTSNSGVFEVWHRDKEGVGAADGSNLIELNATGPSTIHQDFATTPGSTIRWSFYHRGRAGKESMEVLLGSSRGSLTSVVTVKSGDRWNYYSGSYTVPDGQTSTRIAFTALEPGSVGNLLDAVAVSVER